MAAAAATSDAAKADSYIGSFISLITKFDIRYEGFLFHLDSQESTIGLRNVKSFGTEGRKNDGPQVSPSDTIYEYIYFRGSDIKDLQVLSAPPDQSTITVPDDPAIILPLHPHPPSGTNSFTSPSALQETKLSAKANLGLNVLPPQQPVEASGSWAPLVPASPVNVLGPALSNYWPGFTGQPGGNSKVQQQPFPPPPSSLVYPNPIQQSMQHASVNTSLAGGAFSFTEFPHPLLSPVCTGSVTFISTANPPSSVQSSHIPLATLLSNVSSKSKLTNASSALPSAMVDSSSQMESSLPTSSNVYPSIPSITDKAQSLLGPAPFPVIPKYLLNAVDTSSASHGKASVISQPASDLILQPGFVGSSSSVYLKAENDDGKNVLASTSNPQPSYPENAEGPAWQILKPRSTKLHEDASSSHYGNRHHMQGRGDGDGMHREIYQTYQSNRGRVQGRGRARGTWPNRASMPSYQSYRGHPVGRGSGLVAGSLYPQYVTGAPGRANGPSTVTQYPRRYVASHVREGRSQVLQAVTRFAEDFDFEAMNQKFNKEEVWGLLGRNNQAGAEEEQGERNEGDGSNALDEAGDGSPKLDHSPVYCKDDFFDSISCHALDAQSGKGKMKFSEQKKLDAETFGEASKSRRDRGILGPPRGGFQGSYRGRVNDNAGRRRGRTFWSRVA